MDPDEGRWVVLLLRAAGEEDGRRRAVLEMKTGVAVPF